VVALSGGLLILPFALSRRSPGSSRSLPKQRLIRLTKIAECLIMTVGGAGLTLRSLPLCLGALFLLGTQATFFGPLKYGALPELLPAKRLVQATRSSRWGGTFLAILLVPSWAACSHNSLAARSAATVLGVAALATCRRVACRNCRLRRPDLHIDKRWLRDLGD